MTLKKINLNKELKKIFAFKSQDEKDEFKSDLIHIDLIHQIYLRMKLLNISKAELARELNTSKSFITQLFTGNKHLNLKLIAKISRILKLKFIPQFKEFNTFDEIIYNEINYKFPIEIIDDYSVDFKSIPIPENFEFEDKLYGKVV